MALPAGRETSSHLGDPLYRTIGIGTTSLQPNKETLPLLQERYIESSAPWWPRPSSLARELGNATLHHVACKLRTIVTKACKEV